MAGELALRIVDRTRLDAMRALFAIAELQGELSPALKREMEAAITDLEAGLPKGEKPEIRKQDLEVLRELLGRPGGSLAKDALPSLIRILVKVRGTIEYQHPWTESEEEQPALVMLDGSDGGLYRALIRPCPLLHREVRAWPNPIPFEGGGISVIEDGDLLHLEQAMNGLAERLDWMDDVHDFDDREVADVTWQRLRALVARARGHAGWAVSIEKLP